MILACAIQVVGKIPFIIKPDFLPFIYVNALSIGFGMTMTYIIFNTNRNNITDILEVQNGRRIDTLVSGCDNMIAKLSESLAIEIMSIALSFAGYNEALGVAQTSATLTTIEIMLGLAPALLFAGIAIISRNLDTKKELVESMERRDNA